MVVMGMAMMAMMAGWRCGYGGMAMALRMVQGGRIGVTPVRRRVVAGMAALHITGQPAVRARLCVAAMQVKELETAFC